MAKAKAAPPTGSTFERSLHAAVTAGWWTVVLWAALMTVSWFIWLALLHCQPRWVLWMWGGGELEWPKVQELCLWFFGAFKVVGWAFLLVVVFLTLWLRRLRRA